MELLRLFFISLFSPLGIVYMYTGITHHHDRPFLWCGLLLAAFPFLIAHPAKSMALGASLAAAPFLIAWVSGREDAE
jgi:hypothetical protein